MVNSSLKTPFSNMVVNEEKSIIILWHTHFCMIMAREGSIMPRELARERDQSTHVNKDCLGIKTLVPFNFSLKQKHNATNITNIKVLGSIVIIKAMRMRNKTSFLAVMKL